MAVESDKKGTHRFIKLSPGEAVEIIALLSGLLARRSAPGCVNGANPTIHIHDKGAVEYLVLFVDHEFGGT